MTETKKLKLFTTIRLPAVSRLAFKAANVGWTDERFNHLFFNEFEKSVPGAKLAASRLEQNSIDDTILKELGGRAETALAHLFVLLKRQARGKEGILLTNGYSNIFYICRMAVDANWNPRERFWCIKAHFIHDLQCRRAGDRVFSCV